MASLPSLCSPTAQVSLLSSRHIRCLSNRYLYLLFPHAPQSQQYILSRMAAITSTLKCSPNAPSFFPHIREQPHYAPNTLQVGEIIIILDSSLSLTSPTSNQPPSLLVPQLNVSQVLSLISPPNATSYLTLFTITSSGSTSLTVRSGPSQIHSLQLEIIFKRRSDHVSSSLNPFKSFCFQRKVLIRFYKLFMDPPLLNYPAESLPVCHPSFQQ